MTPASPPCRVPRTRDARRRLRRLVVLSGLALVALPAAAHADPVVGNALPLVNTTERIGPGIMLRHVQALGPAGWFYEQLLTVHLGNPDVSTNLLSADSVAEGEPLSQQADSVGAVAGVNGDFFDINNSYAAQGAEVQSGQLVKTPSVGDDPTDTFGVSDSGIAQLVNAAVSATATLNGTSHPVASVNAADANGAGANALVAYTPAWGSYSRARAFTGAADVAEAIIENGKVASIDTTGAGSGTLPAGSFSLVGQGTSADAIKSLSVGDPVSLSYGLTDSAAQSMRFAIGDGGVIVSGGQPVSGLDPSVAPRTAVGFKDDGHTLVLATWDGPGGTGVGGIGIDTEAADLAADGVQTAVNLDGGGSTTMVARALGAPEATVRNTPSDGTERTDPNGIGVFVAPGDGQADQLILRPDTGQAALDGSVRVFPGMHRRIAVSAVDDHQTPVPLNSGDVDWATSAGSISDGVLAAPLHSPGSISVSARDGSVHKQLAVQVLGALHDLSLSGSSLSFASATASDAQTVTVTGRDAQGFSAPIDPADVSLQYDHSIVSVAPSAGGLAITPLAAGSTVLDVSAQGQSVQLPISVGTTTETPYTFDDDVTTRWENESTSATTFSKVADGLQISFAAMRNIGFTAVTSADDVPIPGDPLSVSVKLQSSISVPDGLTYLGYVDAAGDYHGVYGTGLTAGTGWQEATFTIPAGTDYPISFDTFQGINPTVTQQQAGTFVIGAIEAQVPTPLPATTPAPLAPDPLVSDDGQLPSGSGDWTFGTLADIGFDADNPKRVKVAKAAIARVRATNPDLIVLDGNITDRGEASDFAKATQVLGKAGCDLVPVTSTPSQAAPHPAPGTVPCYYVPGTGEANQGSGTSPSLANFSTALGQPYGVFDHDGTRFILLASSLGSLHGTDWAQLPMLQQALQGAASDPAIHNVLVFSGEPVDDPASTGAAGDPNELSDRDEVTLLEQMLTQFRETAHKGVAMIGGQAGVASVERREGVPYAVLPSAGGPPNGTPDRGGFTGWADWSVDPAGKPSGAWLTGDMHAWTQSIALDAPPTLAKGATATLSGSLVQPNGVFSGTRVVPLQYPMSVDWGGSANLAIGTGAVAIDAARRHHDVAILDPATRVLTALRQGTVTVTVTSDSMRADTGAGSLAPIVAHRTITVLPRRGVGAQRGHARRGRV